MTDAPNAPESRMGLGDTSSELETVPVALETREPLGALFWGYKVRDQANSAIELLGGTDADCKEAPSANWGKTLDQFYAGYALPWWTDDVRADLLAQVRDMKRPS